jgi:hypothetical protein
MIVIYEPINLQNTHPSHCCNQTQFYEILPLYHTLKKEPWAEPAIAKDPTLFSPFGVDVKRKYRSVKDTSQINAEGDCVLSVSSPPDSPERLAMAGRWKLTKKSSQSCISCLKNNYIIFGAFVS